MNVMYPEALLLAIPAIMVWYRYLHTGGAAGVLRLLVLLLLVCALTVPSVRTGGAGLDLWVLVDRSESIPDQGRSEIDETITRLRDYKPAHSNLGIIEFAGETRVTRHPGQATREHRGTELATGATDLHGALKRLFSLRDPERPTRALVLSDGRYTTRDPLPLGMWARARDLPVDYRYVGKPDVGDVSVLDVDLPGEVDSGEPFRITAWIQAPASENVSYQLKRGNTVIDRGTRSVQPGRNRWLFRDVLEASGITTYTLRISPSGRDRVADNNRDIGAVRIRTEHRVLVIQPTVQQNRFVSSLTDAGIPVVQRAVNNAFRSQADLDEFQCVILENVSGNSLGRDRMMMLKNWVTNLGGSLLMTGGTRSFARGGYLASPLEEVLPVSMKLQQEKRRTRASVAVVLDRSGSMSAGVGGGQMKMDLANRAAVEAVNVLNGGDEVAVIAVDHSAHVVVPLQRIQGNRETVTNEIFNIRPGGGGIYAKTGLEAAINQLANSRGATKHVILFADARDSQERRRVREQVQRWNRSGVTVSVVGLGSSGDVHASFLEDVASRGGGEVHFTSNPKDLPRIFVQDVIRNIRRSFIKKQRALVTTPHLTMLTGRTIGDPPPIGGFNVTREKDKASVPLRVVDDGRKRPGLALWNYGLGRAAAITFEMDGEYTGPFLNWDHYPELSSLLVRWLMAKEQNESVSASFEREGSIGTIRVTLNPDRERSLTNADPIAFVSTPGAGGQKVPLEWSGPDQLRATVPLKQEGIYIGAVDLGGEAPVELPPIGLGYPPEFRTGSGPSAGANRGSELLGRLADVSGGRERINLKRAYDTSKTGQVRWLLAVPLMLLALLFFVLEIACRRIRLMQYLYVYPVVRLIRRVPAGVRSFFARITSSDWTEGWGSDDDQDEYGDEIAPAGESTPSGSASVEEPEGEDEEESDDTGTVLGRAKSRARRRMDEE